MAAAVQGLVGALGVGVSNLDGLGLGASLFTLQKGNTVQQEFQRKLSEIDYRIQRQQLYREDIRDLMELTVSRMDIYHVVGTLLLTFCVTWYTDNKMLDKESQLPEWYVTLFLVSNFSACGYLVFSVWLAMHASIAANSIGVRLLTSYVRLSIPSKEYLDKIKVSIMPFVDQFLDMGRRLVKAVPRGLAKATQGPAPDSAIEDVTAAGLRRRRSSAAPTGGSSQAQPLRLRRSVSSGTDSGDASGDAEDTAVPQDEDEQRHFRRFLQEQTRWLSYDAYSRVCMSCGMNQLLQALAYYVLGIVWGDSPITAVISFAAIELLGLLLLLLDMDNTSRDRRGQAAFFFFYISPPILGGMLLWAPEFHLLSEFHVVMLSGPCFLLHAAWVMYVERQVCSNTGVTETSAGPAALLPGRLRTVRYLNVVSLVQRRLASDVHAEEAMAAVRLVREARADLEGAVAEQMEREAASGHLNAADRATESLTELQQLLKRSLDAARSAVLTLGNGTSTGMEAELISAGQVLEHFEVWQRTPDIFASLQALRNPELDAWLGEEDRAAVEQSYQAFLQSCQELNLGVHPEDSADERLVHVRAFSDLASLPHSVWITGCGAFQHEASPKELLKSTSFNSTLLETLPEWTSDAVRVRQRLQSLPLVREGPSRREASRPAALSNNVNPTSNQNSTPLGWAPLGDGASQVDPPTPSQVATQADRIVSVLPARARPPDLLPGKVVRFFMICTMVWWVWSAVLFVSSGLYEHYIHHKHIPSLALHQVRAAWPAPAKTFSVASLHCGNGAHVTVGSEFALHAAHLNNGSDGQDSLSLGTLRRLRPGYRGLAALSCGADAGDCVELSPDWSLDEPLSSAPPLGATREWRLDKAVSVAAVAPHWSPAWPRRVSLPSRWRRVALAWDHTPPSCSGADSEARPELPGPRASAWVAAWDGDQILLATLRLQVDGSSGAAAEWKVRTRFRVGPTGRDQFRDVRALHFGIVRRGAADIAAARGVDALADGGGALGGSAGTLVVLHGSAEVEGWDLRRGVRLGRWRVGGRRVARKGGHSAMCHDGRNLFLASASAGAGPVLEKAELPQELQSLAVAPGGGCGTGGTAPSASAPSTAPRAVPVVV